MKNPRFAAVQQPHRSPSATENYFGGLFLSISFQILSGGIKKRRKKKKHSRFLQYRILGFFSVSCVKYHH